MLFFALFQNLKKVEEISLKAADDGDWSVDSDEIRLLDEYVDGGGAERVNSLEGWECVLPKRVEYNFHRIEYRSWEGRV